MRWRITRDDSDEQSRLLNSAAGANNDGCLRKGLCASHMSILGIGVDLVECARIQHSFDRFGEKFLRRVFTDGEIEYSMSMKFPARHLAARFAGKEAVAKAFGTGIGKAMGWRNIDIRKKKSGEPFLVFSGPAQELATKRGVTSALITLSHTDHHAVACVVLEAT